MISPGPIVLFGSGEAAPAARRAHAAALEPLPPPVHACVLETPAGFEPNSARVAGRLAEFLRHRFQVETCVVSARKRGTPESPEEPSVVAPLLTANYIMLGPGSPTYAVSQLAESLAWRTVLARHRLGAALAIASAATIAAGAFAIPVYEIYKVGQDLHWQPGLDLLGPFGWRVTVVAHWNNREGGAELDTSHAYIGRERFAQLQTMLPSDVDVLGIDEHTAVVLNFALGTAKVFGSGGMTWLHGGRELRFDAGASVPLETFGLSQQPAGSKEIPTDVWDSVRQAHEQIAMPAPAEPTALIHALVSERGRARACADWARADGLRRELASAGWEVRDTPDGPILTRI